MIHENTILPQRCYRRAVDFDRTTLTRLPRRATAHDRSARRRRCHLYVCVTGCQWRYLPKDFPPKSTVWRYYNQWRHNGTFDTIHDLLRTKSALRRSPTRPEPPRAWTVSPSIPPPVAKRVAGTMPKMSMVANAIIVVDSMGLLLAVLVTAADVDDATAAATLFTRLDGPAAQPRQAHVRGHQIPQLHLYEWVERNAALGAQHRASPQGCRRAGLKLPIRWTVERTFAWLGKCRRLSKDRERSVLSSETFVRLAMIHLMLNRLEPKDPDAEFHYRSAA